MKIVCVGLPIIFAVPSQKRLKLLIEAHGDPLFLARGTHMEVKIDSAEIGFTSVVVVMKNDIRSEISVAFSIEQLQRCE